MRFPAPATLIAPLLLLLAACAKPDTEDQHPDTVLRVALSSDIHIIEPLLTYRNDLSVAPLLAEQWAIDADGRSYDFFLRKGVTFHNGEERGLA